MSPARARLAFGLVAAPALLMRFHNAFAYPADWGFDASHNWRYIHALTRSWQLPTADAAWSTADPPLFFYLSALLLRCAGLEPVLIPLLNTLLGLGVVALAMRLVRRAAPADPERALLAGALLLYLPAHVHMSAMVNEEMLAAFCTSVAMFSVAAPREGGSRSIRRALWAGAASGAAMLSKASGALAAVAGAGALAWSGWRAGSKRAALRSGAILLASAALLGGWFYARNQLAHGSPLPSRLPAHARMLGMPPGERGVLDYLRFPLATFTDPQLLHPALLRSVWGSTYATAWFDAHRYFLPTDSAPVRRLGTLLLTLALLPSAAFCVGLARGATRRSATDAPLVLLTLLTLLAYAAYSWRNPWFAVLKGTALLGLSLPYAYYASEVLTRWLRRSRLAAFGIGAALAVLALCVLLSGTFGLAFERSELPGLRWEEVRPT